MSERGLVTVVTGKLQRQLSLSAHEELQVFMQHWIVTERQAE